GTCFNVPSSCGGGAPGGFTAKAHGGGALVVSPIARPANAAARPIITATTKVLIPPLSVISIAPSFVYGYCSSLTPTLSRNGRGRASRAQICALDLGVLRQLARGTGQGDAAVLQHVSAVGELERDGGHLLDQDDGHALIAQRANGARDLQHD